MKKKKPQEIDSYERLSPKVCAERLDLTTRQLRNLVKDWGMPSLAGKNGREFPWPRVMHWYIQYKIDLQAERSAPADLDAARLRKLLAEAEEAETRVAVLRARLLDQDYLSRQVEGILIRLQAALKAFPARVAGPLGTCSTSVARQTYLEEEIAQLTLDLQKTLDDPTLDEEPEEEEPEEGDVAVEHAE